MSKVTAIMLPDLCQVAMDEMDKFEADDMDNDRFVDWLEEHAKTCPACTQLINMIQAAMTGSNDEELSSA